MQAQGHSTPGVCPETSENGATVSISVDDNHPFLQLQRALPWAALCEVRTRRWAAAGKTTAGRPGFPWDVALDVPWVVLMGMQPLPAREMAASLAEQGVARVCMGRQGAPRPQMRDHATMARAYAALGQAGLDAVKALRLKGAKDCGVAALSILSSDTTASTPPATRSRRSSGRSKHTPCLPSPNRQSGRRGRADAPRGASWWWTRVPW